MAGQAGTVAGAVAGAVSVIIVPVEWLVLPPTYADPPAHIQT
jgi:hypothetical protein